MIPLQCSWETAGIEWHEVVDDRDSLTSTKPRGRPAVRVDTVDPRLRGDGSTWRLPDTNLPLPDSNSAVMVPSETVTSTTNKARHHEVVVRAVVPPITASLSAPARRWRRRNKQRLDKARVLLMNTEIKQTTEGKDARCRS